MAYYFTADTHFGHRSMLKLCDRIFPSLNQMDKTLIRNWNESVSPEDTVFILGDFAYRNARPAAGYLKKLNGIKILLRGNHDDQWLGEMTAEEKQHFFRLILEDHCVAEINGFRIGLSHKPTDRFQTPVDIIVCGHIHSNKAGEDYEAFMSIPNILNAGVDICRFKPMILRDLVAANEAFYGRRYSFPQELFNAFE